MAAVAGYGLTLSVVGAEMGVPLYGIGSGVSFGGTLLESATTTNWQQGATSIGGFALDNGSKILINRIPGTQLTRHILRQNTGLKINLIEKFINNN